MKKIESIRLFLSLVTVLLIFWIHGCYENGCPQTGSNADGDADADSDSDSEPIEPYYACAEGSKPGPAGSTSNYSVDNAVYYDIRTPESYHPTERYPLILVVAPMGKNRNETETLTDLTSSAIEADYIIAYADFGEPYTTAAPSHASGPPNSGPLLGATIEDLSTRWCVDQSHIYLAGSSIVASMDMSEGPVFHMESPPAALAPITGDMGGTAIVPACPVSEAIPIMILQSQEELSEMDSEAFGTTKWVDCNGCANEPAEVTQEGCEVYTDCDNGVQVRYCDSEEQTLWPDFNASLIDFFDSF